MKNTFTKFASVAVIALALVQTIQATPIPNPVIGNIGFTGRAQFNTGSAGSATEVLNWVAPAVNGTTGSFTTVANGTSVNFSPAWFFVTTSPIANFWSVGGFTFQLLSSSVTVQGGSYPNGFVVVNGTGLVSGNGYDTTALSWSFTCQDPATTSNPQTFTFSASSASLPDGGATVALLGIALSGVGLLRKKLTA